MNKLRMVWVLLTTLLLVACGGNTPESFGETAFSHLKAQNIEELNNLAANEDDYFSLIAERNKTSEEQINATPKDVEQIARKNQQKVNKSIDDIIAYGKMNGGWDDASLVKVEVKQSEKEPNEADVYINVDMNGKHFRIMFDDLAKADRGWVMTDNPRWVGLVYDPKFDKLLEQTRTIPAGENFLSCKTSDDLGFVELMVNNDPEAVFKLIDENKCMLKQLEADMTVTIDELGSYTSGYSKGKSDYPFGHVKVSFEIDGQQHSQWVLSDWVIAFE